MKTITILGAIGGASGLLYSYNRWGKLKEAYKQLDFKKILDLGELKLKGEKLTGYVKIGITNPTTESFVATVSRLDLVDASGLIIGQGKPSPGVVRISPESITEVKIDFDIPLKEDEQQQRIADFILASIRGEYTQSLRLVWKVVGKEVKYDIPVKDLMSDDDY